MNEIKCPHCGKVFQVDESGFAAIVKQVRDREFDREINRHTEALEAEKQLAVQQALGSAQKTLSEKDAHIAKLQTLLAAQEQKQQAQEKLMSAEHARALSDALSEKSELIIKLEQQLQTQTASFEAQKQLAVEQARGTLERKCSDLSAQLALKDAEKHQIESAFREKLSAELKAKDDIIAYKNDEIERYRDMKARLSTKMVGESLEQHCEIEFNKIRATAFPQAYFEKDNDASSGSKGDFIFRECDTAGNEILSIMFEMKNESDDSVHRHKNEDFFKKLDADRVKKKCEYAVLVSLLEPENELYNQGIVDVSYRFEKMYVIRPQFFIPLISILRNAAQKSMSYKAELAIVRNQNIDITHFEEQMESFKMGFARNYDLASRKFKTAIEEIDKTIVHLQKTKEALLSSENNLRLANNKAQELSIKRLTKNNKTMKAAFDALSANEPDSA